MDAPKESTTPPRTGVRRLISPVDYRHLRACAGIRIASGVGLSGLGVVTLSIGEKDGRRSRGPHSGWYWERFNSLRLLGDDHRGSHLPELEPSTAEA